MESELLVDREGPIAWLTLNRPDRLNALTTTMLDQLADALTELEHGDAKVVVIRGAGRAFSAGYDINPDAEEVGEAPRRGPVADRNRQAAYIERFTRIWRHPQPVIAAIHGFCMAGTSQLACFCDITVVAEDAVIAASPALPLGGGFISPLWSFRVGPQRAKEMSFVPGRRIDGRTAVDWGFANTAVPAAQLESYVRDLALSIATVPAPVLQMKKLAVNRVQEIQGFLTIAGFGADTDALIHTTSDVAEIQDLVRDVGIKEAIRRFSGAQP
ncbi:MAG: enoyl-CoA hydratase-related protein [Actinomycetota bacterium]|nr:enoyl-CoA hydratase-related protein [Actinomycetota bacterium]